MTSSSPAALPEQTAAPALGIVTTVRAFRRSADNLSGCDRSRPGQWETRRQRLRGRFRRRRLHSRAKGAGWTRGTAQLAVASEWSQFVCGSWQVPLGRRWRCPRRGCLGHCPTRSRTVFFDYGVLPMRRLMPRVARAVRGPDQPRWDLVVAACGTTAGGREACVPVSHLLWQLSIAYGALDGRVFQGLSRWIRRAPGYRPPYRSLRASRPDQGRTEDHLGH